MTLQIDHQSPTWRALKRDIEARIEVLRAMLEAPGDTEATATLRGQIKELRALIERVEPPASASPKPDAASTTPLY